MPKHILIVEDEPNIIESLSFLLERAGYFVSSEKDGSMAMGRIHARSEEHTSELQSRRNLVCRLLLEKKKT